MLIFSQDLLEIKIKNDNFNHHKNTPDGHDNICIDCKKIYKQENKESIKEYNKNYNQENKEVIKQKVKDRYDIKKDEILEKHRQWYQSKKDELLQKKIDYSKIIVCCPDWTKEFQITSMRLHKLRKHSNDKEAHEKIKSIIEMPTGGNR